MFEVVFFTDILRGVLVDIGQGIGGVENFEDFRASIVSRGHSGVG